MHTQSRWPTVSLRCFLSYHTHRGFGALLRDTAAGHSCFVPPVSIVSTPAPVSTFCCSWRHGRWQQLLVWAAVAQCCLWLVSWHCQTGRESELADIHTHTHTKRPWQYGRLKESRSAPRKHFLPLVALMLICWHTKKAFVCVYTCKDLH